MDNNPKENCPVCFGKANPKKPFHCHYGAICCLKCRSFFRRVVQSNGTANLEKVFYCVNSKLNTLNKRCDMREFGTRHKCSYCRLQLAPSVDMALTNDFEESSPQIKDEALENYDDQMMLGLTNSVSLDFTEAVAETSVPQDLLKILKHYFYTETSMMKEDIYSKISKHFEIFCFKEYYLLFLYYSSNHELNFHKICVQKWFLQVFDIW